VAATHLAGGCLNLSPHQHVIALDGVYSTSVDGEHVVFTATRAPAQSELRDVVDRGHVDDDGVAHGADPDQSRGGMRRNTPWSAEHEGWSPTLFNDGKLAD
jgi:hypothetical protein